MTLARSLGAAGRPVDAARAIVRGSVRSLGLLVDESGGVVLGGLRIPGRGGPGQGLGAATEPGRAAAAGPSRTRRRTVPQQADGEAAERSLRANKAAAARGLLLTSTCLEWGSQLARTARTVAAQLIPARSGPGQALRVEADGHLLADLDHPIRLLAAWNAGTRGGAEDTENGLMEVLVSPPSAAEGPLRVRARRITVTGGPSTSFTYEADDAPGGPVQQRTWTVEPAAWQLTVPPAA